MNDEELFIQWYSVGHIQQDYQICIRNQKSKALSFEDALILLSELEALGFNPNIQERKK